MRFKGIRLLTIAVFHYQSASSAVLVIATEKSYFDGLTTVWTAIYHYELTNLLEVVFLLVGPVW